MTAFHSELKSCISRGQEYLLARQSNEGTWHDFALEPGSSDAWVTAVVGFSLFQSLRIRGSEAIVRASKALLSLKRGSGWGYNRLTASDADSTAWALRFLGQLDKTNEKEYVAMLEYFLDENGEAHTFKGDQFGTWSHAHPDVTPVVGMALLVVSPLHEKIAVIRDAVLKACAGAALWGSFWWESIAYSVAVNLEFLSATGGVPDSISKLVDEWLTTEVAGSSLAAAQLLSCAYVLKHPRLIELCRRLIRMQSHNGQWPPSNELHIPAQTRSASFVTSGDPEGLFSTAIALIALQRILSSESLE